MSVASWEVAFQLSTPQGTLNLNAPVTLPSTDTGIFLLNPSSCKASVPLRVVDDDVPQGDGEITHDRFFKGYLMSLAVQLWDTTDSPACDDLLQEMTDVLMRHVRAYATRPALTTDARVFWTPNGATQRMIKRAQLNEPADITLEDGGITQVAWEVKSPYPYAWTAAETTTALNATLTNNGTADFWPVIKVYGPSAAFVIENASVVDDLGNPLQISYDAGLPGAISIPGGSYAEIDTFRNTIYLNGNQNNLKPGIDMGVTDFFPIAVGANSITITGATADVLWQDAWA